MKDYTEQEKAIALEYVIDHYGDDFAIQDPEGAAVIMEVFIDGRRSL